jgi:hypothetical protein
VVSCCSGPGFGGWGSDEVVDAEGGESEERKAEEGWVAEVIEMEVPVPSLWVSG